MNRRNWLKNATLLGAGATVLPSLFQEAKADPAIRQEIYNHFLQELQYANFEPYAGKIRLNANENPHGPSEKAKKAVIEALPDSYMYAGKAL
ncbi:MAG: histidinol phosphate aminotransferase, partial [Verrucomicrobia bacterium]|nr:histidinol phosphate aminotransferase [Cytophagales bacterium]